MSIESGSWVVIMDGGGPYWNRPRPFVEQIDKATERTVSRGRRRWTMDQVTPMPDEASAKRLCERLISARSEAERRESAAWDAYRDAVERLLKGTPA